MFYYTYFFNIIYRYYTKAFKQLFDIKEQYLMMLVITTKGFFKSYNNIGIVEVQAINCVNQTTLKYFGLIKPIFK